MATLSSKIMGIGDLIVIGLGGNVGGDVAVRSRFSRAREALGAVKSSSLYRTAPIGAAQADFLNAAIAVRWDDAQPDELIARVLETERMLGRDRRSEARWGPRAIDLDVLWWADHAAVRQPDLEVPHPRLAERRFALLPLLDLIQPPELVAAEARVRDQRVELIASSW